MSIKTCSVLVLLIAVTLVGVLFQDLVSVDVEISQVKRFDTVTNCYQDDSRQYVSSITQFSVGFFSPKTLNLFSQLYWIW